MPEHRQGRREGVPAFLFGAAEDMSRDSPSSAPSAQARGGKMEGASPRQFSQAPPALRWRSVAASVLRFPETEDLPCSGRVSGNAHKGRNGTEPEHTHMSIIHTAYTAVCNSCGKILRDAAGGIRTFSSNVGAIQAAREEGWAVNQSGDKDYCPNCRKNLQ